jgi:hypothetical protein
MQGSENPSRVKRRSGTERYLTRFLASSLLKNLARAKW